MMEVGLTMMLGIGPVQAACRKTFQQTFHIYIYIIYIYYIYIYIYISNPPVHPSMIQQQARRISPVRFSFDGLQNQLRSDLWSAQISVVVQHGALVACDIHHNKLHNEEWFGNKIFHVDTFIIFHQLVRAWSGNVNKFRFSVSLSLPSRLFSLLPLSGQLAKGFERYTHITSRHYMSLRSSL